MEPGQRPPSLAGATTKPPRSRFGESCYATPAPRRGTLRDAHAGSLAENSRPPPRPPGAACAPVLPQPGHGALCPRRGPVAVRPRGCLQSRLARCLLSPSLAATPRAASTPRRAARPATARARSTPSARASRRRSWSRRAFRSSPARPTGPTWSAYVRHREPGEAEWDGWIWLGETQALTLLGHARPTSRTPSGVSPTDPMHADTTLPERRDPLQHGTPSDRLTPSAARLRDFADRLDAEGSHRMAALVRRAADGVAPEVLAPRT